MAKETEFTEQVKNGYRFEFGKNWRTYLKKISQDRIRIAENSLKKMLCLNDMRSKKFLDIGCGSGLFSLAARRLNAEVCSVDFDPYSIQCTHVLKNKFYPSPANNWQITEGSVLDTKFIEKLPKSDIVYSWGVLHHTGNMYQALENVILPVKDNGLLFIAIYNNEGQKSKIWLKVKKLYNSSLAGKILVLLCYFPLFFMKGFLKDVFTLKNPIKRYSDYKKNRGMSIFSDWVDWLGGLPFEVAKPEKIIEFYKQRGLTLQKITTTNGMGNNQFVFKKNR